jgi:hypothetical protein
MRKRKIVVALSKTVVLWIHDVRLLNKLMFSLTKLPKSHGKHCLLRLVFKAVETLSTRFSSSNMIIARNTLFSVHGAESELQEDTRQNTFSRNWAKQKHPLNCKYLDYRSQKIFPILGFSLRNPRMSGAMWTTTSKYQAAWIL